MTGYDLKTGRPESIAIHLASSVISARLPSIDRISITCYDVYVIGGGASGVGCAPDGRTVPPINCKEGPLAAFSKQPGIQYRVSESARMVGRGAHPPYAEPISVENGKPVLQEFGNVTGGDRSAFVDVPTAVWSGSSSGESFCFIAGNEKAFDHARLTQLYSDHKSYVGKVTADVATLVKARWITREDGEEVIAEAKRAGIP